MGTGTTMPLLAFGAWRFGAVGVVAAYLLASTFSLVLTTRAAQGTVGDGSIVLRATRRSLAAAALMLVAVVSYSALAPTPLVLTLLTQILLGAVLYVVVRIRLFTSEERAFVRTLPLPAFVTR